MIESPTRPFSAAGPVTLLSNKIRNSSGRAGLLWLWQSFLKDNVDTKRSVLVAQRHY